MDANTRAVAAAAVVPAGGAGGASSSAPVLSVKTIFAVMHGAFDLAASGPAIPVFSPTGPIINEGTVDSIITISAFPGGVLEGVTFDALKEYILKYNDVDLSYLRDVFPPLVFSRPIDSPQVLVDLYKDSLVLINSSGTDIPADDLRNPTYGNFYQGRAAGYLDSTYSTMVMNCYAPGTKEEPTLLMNWNYYAAKGTDLPWIKASIGLWDSNGKHLETPAEGYRTTTQELLARIVTTYNSPGQRLRIIFISCGEFYSGYPAYDHSLKRLANSALFLPNPSTGQKIKLATYWPASLSSQLEALSRHASSESLTLAISSMKVGGKRRTYRYRSKYYKLKRRQSKKNSRSKTRR